MDANTQNKTLLLKLLDSNLTKKKKHTGIKAHCEMPANGITYFQHKSHFLCALDV